MRTRSHSSRRSNSFNIVRVDNQETTISIYIIGYHIHEIQVKSSFRQSSAPERIPPFLTHWCLLGMVGIQWISGHILIFLQRHLLRQAPPDLSQLGGIRSNGHYGDSVMRPFYFRRVPAGRTMLIMPPIGGRTSPAMAMARGLLASGLVTLRPLFC